MAFAKFEKPITDAAGNVMPNVQVTVRRETPGAPLAVLYADAGGTTPLSNPHVFSDGVARFYTAGTLGGLRLDAVAAGHARTWRNEACGTGAQVDADTLLGAAFSMAFEPETSAPPGTGGIRADNADLSAATELFVSKVNTAGSSIAGRIGAIVAGDVLLLTASDGTQASWTASGVTDEDTHFAVGVSGHDGETALEAGPVALMISRVGAPSTVPGPPGSRASASTCRSMPRASPYRATCCTGTCSRTRP